MEVQLGNLHFAQNHLFLGYTAFSRNASFFSSISKFLLYAAVNDFTLAALDHHVYSKAGDEWLKIL